jgi:2-methylisocitrate lyase-like PEP mutase family enzyme
MTTITTSTTAPPPGAAERAATLRSLHRPGDPLVLVNAWDVASALAVTAAGGRAIATSSAAIAAAAGVPDDDTMDADLVFGTIARIAGAVPVPVSADLEAGYGMPADELVERLIGAGGVGCNLEDTDHRDPGALVDGDLMASRIAAVRHAAGRAGVPVVVNARIDVLVRGGFDSRPAAIAEVLRRARRYRDAGADCIYPIGMAGPEEAAELVAGIGGWVNGNVGPNVTVAQMAAAGVSRISVGPTFHRQAMADLAERAAALLVR